MSAQPTTGPVYEAVIQGSQFTAATCGDILAKVPGLSSYATIPNSSEGDERAFNARLEHAFQIAARMQAGVAAAAANDGTWDQAAATEDELTAVLGDRTIVMQIDEWDHPVPLFLVSVNYAPFTTVPVPAGNVVLLDPSDELMYLKSLEGAGLLQLVALPAADDDM